MNGLIFSFDGSDIFVNATIVYTYQGSVCYFCTLSIGKLISSAHHTLINKQEAWIYAPLVHALAGLEMRKTLLCTHSIHSSVQLKLVSDSPH